MRIPWWVVGLGALLFLRGRGAAAAPAVVVPPSILRRGQTLTPEVVAGLVIADVIPADAVTVYLDPEQIAPMVRLGPGVYSVSPEAIKGKVSALYTGAENIVKAAL